MTTTNLDPTLAAILARHGVLHTVDALLQEFERRGERITLTYNIDRHLIQREAWDACRFGPHWLHRYPGPTALVALSLAFAALIAEGER